MRSSFCCLKKRSDVRTGRETVSAQSIQDTHRALGIHRAMEVAREEYRTFHSKGPPMFTEISGPLLGLKEEWREQGPSETEIDFSAF